MSRGIVDWFRGIGKGSSWHETAKEEGDTRGNEGDEDCLELEEGKTAGDHGATYCGVVKLADIGCCCEPGGEVHFEISVEVKDGGDDHN